MPEHADLIVTNGWPLSYAWRTLKNAGARIVFASDWPVSPIDPIAGMQAAMLHKRWADGMPDHSFTPHEAPAGYTVEGAYAGFMEDRKGRLKPGYLADLVVLSGDIEAADLSNCTKCGRPRPSAAARSPTRPDSGQP